MQTFDDPSDLRLHGTISGWSYHRKVVSLDEYEREWIDYICVTLIVAVAAVPMLVFAAVVSAV